MLSTATDLPHYDDNVEEEVVELETFNVSSLKPSPVVFDSEKMHKNLAYLSSVDVRRDLAVQKAQEFLEGSSADSTKGVYRSSPMDAARVSLVEAFEQTRLWCVYMHYEAIVVKDGALIYRTNLFLAHPLSSVICWVLFAVVVVLILFCYLCVSSLLLSLPGLSTSFIRD